MTGGLADCPRNRNEYRLLENELGTYPQFLSQLPNHSFPWVFIRFDVPACGKPEFGIDVIDEEYVITIDQKKVGNEMRTGRIWFGDAKQPGTRVNPIEREIDMTRFGLIQRGYLSNHLSDFGSHLISPIVLAVVDGCAYHAR